ncbi:MAG: ABC transporter permease [Bacteroidota bacterium]
MRFALITLGVFLFLGIFSNFLSSSSPIYCSYKGKSYFPAFQETVVLDGVLQSSAQQKWQNLPLESVIWPLIPYGTGIDMNHRTISPLGEQKTYSGERIPLRERHWLGSGRNGLDILSVIIRGSRRALSIGLFTMLIAGIIGILLGSFAGYFQDHKLLLKRASLYLMVPGLLLASFYGFYLRRFNFQTEAGAPSLISEIILSLLIFSLILALFLQLGKRIYWGNFLEEKIPLKVDSYISRIMELIQSLPPLLLILALASFFNSRNIWFVMLIIALVSWMGIARVVRGEMMSISERDFIQAGKALGIKPAQILFRHVLPNSLASVWPILAFGIGSAILAESTLSFLALIEDSQNSWGGMLTEGKLVRQHWWIALFPGISIFLCVYSFNIIGEKLRDFLDPRSQ